MSIRNYELSNKHLPDEIIVQYTNGLLTAIVMPIKHPLNDIQFAKLVGALPSVRLEENIDNFKAINLTVTPEVPRNTKVAMFCEKYMEYMGGEKYTANGIDGKHLEMVKVTYELLDTYFRSKEVPIKGYWSIRNFVKNYNLVKREHAGIGGGKFPNHYDAEFDKKLSIAERTQYNRHLRDLGLIVKKDSLGNVIDWIRKEAHHG